MRAYTQKCYFVSFACLIHEDTLNVKTEELASRLTIVSHEAKKKQPYATNE